MNSIKSLFALCLCLTPLLAEIPTIYYFLDQINAPEQLRITPFQVDTTEEVTETSTYYQFHIHISMQAAVTEVTRSDSEVSIGDTIQLNYTYTHQYEVHKENGDTGWILGPGDPGMLEVEQNYPAFLSYNEEELCYKPAAGSHSFRYMKDVSPQNGTVNDTYFFPEQERDKFYIRWDRPLWKGIEEKILSKYYVSINGQRLWETTETDMVLSRSEIENAFVAHGVDSPFKPEILWINGGRENDTLCFHVYAEYSDDTSTILSHPSDSVCHVIVYDDVNVSKNSIVHNKSIVLGFADKTGMLTIDSPTPLTAVALYSANGKLVMVQKGNVKTVSLNSLSAGTYIVQCRGGDAILNQKIILK